MKTSISPSSFQQEVSTIAFEPRFQTEKAQDYHSLRLQGLPNLGLGLNIRKKQLTSMTTHWPELDWLEVISEDFMYARAHERTMLHQLSERYPLVMHGVSMAIGNFQPLNMTYLSRLKKLADEFKPVWVSDHLCWTGVLGANSHKLLPVLFSEESLKHIIKRIHTVQDFLGRALVLETPSTSFSFRRSTMLEWDFLQQLTQATNCGLLLNMNSIYKTCFHNGVNPKYYIDQLPKDKIVQIHVDSRSIDAAKVWDLTAYTIQNAKEVAIMMAGSYEEYTEASTCYNQLFA